MSRTNTQNKARPKFKFLIVSNEPKTAKERELELTQIRTHAARVSYRKRPTPNDSFASKTPTPDQSSSSSSADSSDNDSDDTNSTLSLRTLLGGGRIDPFDSDSVPGLQPWILDLVDNAWTNAWCRLRAHHRGNFIHPDVYGWRRAGLSCPSLVHSHISGAIGIALAQGTWADLGPQLRRVQIYHATQSINYVRKELSRCQGSPPDELLLSIMTLSGHGEVVPDDEDRQRSQTSTVSPLVRANRVDIFAKLSITDAHAQAIGSLVARKGGLDAITLPGFRALLSFTDILQASIKGTQPQLPFVGETESLVSSGRHVLDSKALALNTILGTGFEDAGVVDVSSDLYTALLAACELTAALDHLQRDENNPPTLADIVDARKYVQYRLISLPPDSLSQLSTPDDFIYEAVRLASLIYSDLNVWPLPSSTGARPRLARQLCDCLQSRHFSHSPDHILSADLLLWIAMMGAIASSNGKSAATARHEKYFVELLTSDDRALSWKALHAIMKRYLWCDFVVSPLGQNVWYRACVERATREIIRGEGI
jgi:hypothetical protein